MNTRTNPIKRIVEPNTLAGKALKRATSAPQASASHSKRRNFLAPAILASMLVMSGIGLSRAEPSTGQSIVARGQYLTRLGGCKGCHTRPGGEAFSGGRAIETPFGTLYTPNITPDPKTGLGAWDFEDFYRAMHKGIGREGEYLYPAFPFPAYTKLKRKDVKAIWTYLRTIDPVRQTNKPDQLRWPYSSRGIAMWVWRKLYFTPGAYEANTEHSQQWNRGAYLVRGLAHCGTCHTPRNKLGARLKRLELAGGSVSIEGWYPPNITTNDYAGIGQWSDGDLKAFLTTGRSPRGDALGPMRDVVRSSTQYLNDMDVDAIIAYITSRPAEGPTAPPGSVTSRQGGVQKASKALKEAARTGARIRITKGPAVNPAAPPAGKALYHTYCADCHGDDGRPKHQHYPSLRHNHVVDAPDPTNLLLMILRGGFQASTKTYPYPYSMPPFGFKLSDVQIAAIANYLRGAWSDYRLPTVWPKQVAELR